MQVKRLEINGFKSFGDRTVLDFPHGMCAVVGPNGCGKSNVVDAVRWVLGEQSPRHLRGKSMEDVIFNGAEGRKPQGMAEVSLVFENNGSFNHPQFADLSEIMISRRLYRSGDSEYLINKMPCRLKDIQGLLMDTGLGNRAYAIIEQGGVAAFIEAKPTDRRLWLEEAAGITRYKNQKKVSLRKMEQAQDNINRLMDIILEVETQMRRLERQAKKAQRHKEIRDRIKELDLNISSHEYQELCNDLTQARNESDALGAQLLLANQRVTGLETELETIKLQLINAEQEISVAGEARFGTQGAIQKAENEITLMTRESQNISRMSRRQAEERDSLDSRLEQSQKDLDRARRKGEEAAVTLNIKNEALESAVYELETCQAQVRSLESRVDLCKQSLVDHLAQSTQAKNRLSDLDRHFGELMRRKEGLRARRGEFEEALAEISEARDSAALSMEELQYDLSANEEQLDELTVKRQEIKVRLERYNKEERQASRRHHEIAASLDALAASLASYDWAQDGVRQVLNAVKQGELEVEILGVTAEHLKVKAGSEQLVETALGPDLQAVLVKNSDDAAKLADWAREHEAGQLRVLALSDLPGNGLHPPKGLNPLGQEVRPESGFEPLEALYRGMAVVDDDSTAWQTASGLSAGQSLVAKGGRRFYLAGALAMGKASASTSILARQNRLAELEDQLNQADQALHSARGAREKAEAVLSALDERIAVLKSSHADKERSLHQQEKEHFRLEEAAGAKMRALESLSYDAEEIARELALVQEQNDRLKKELAELDERHPDLEEDLNKAQAGLGEAKTRLETEREKESEYRLAQASLAAQAEHAGREVSRLEREVAEHNQRKELLVTELENASQSLDRLRTRKKDQELALGKLYLTLEEQEKSLGQAQENYNQAKMRSADLEADLKQARQVQRKVETESQNLDLKKQQLGMKRDHVCQQALERCRVDLTSNHQAYLPEGAFDRESARARLDKLRQQLAKLGPVNLEAITEHEALAERHQFLSEQKVDLDSSLEDLNQAVRKINRTSRARFKETLQKVNESMGEIFPVLFKGGSASLTLDENIDPLEAGLNLLVELPGKKVRHLEALSGGEKALSAVAVLFALFLIRPAPICILDEVDAPLDEANVGRFHGLLERLSQHAQIAMITHSRRTMEIADLLYGVTMEEKGVSKLVSVTLRQGATMAA
jgi:chromosome segregation protein